MSKLAIAVAIASLFGLTNAVFAQEAPTTEPSPTSQPTSAPAEPELSSAAIPVIDGRVARVTVSLIGVDAASFTLGYRLASPAGERTGEVEATRQDDTGHFVLEIPLDHDVTPCDATELLLTRPDSGAEVYIMLDYSWDYAC